MKKTYILKTAFLAGAVFALFSCTEEKIMGIDPMGVPMASDYDIRVTVDQETNQFTLNMVTSSGAQPTGVYPVWKIYSSNNPVRTTRNGYSGIITVAGDYDVELQIGNHNGVSEGVKSASIHIENTLINFTPYVANMTGGSSKIWHIDGSVQGHLGCGEPGTDGLNWWSASPFDKQDWGVYDNTMTFTDNGSTDGTGLYTYDPGDSGTIYVNTGITDLPPYSNYNTNDGTDYCAPSELQENVPFTLYAEGVDLMLKFPKGTLFGYLPNVELYNEPKFKVLGITRNKIELVCDNGGIAWHYVLAPFEKEEVFEGFKYDSEFNLWKDAEVILQSTWFADGGWGEISGPEVEVSNKSIKLHTPAGMGGDQWQGQVHIGTNIPVSASETYDFSCYVKADSDIKATVKVQKDGDDNVSFAGQDQIQFYAGGSYYYFSDKPGFDGTLKIAFDFAGNPDMDIEVGNIVFKNHKDDDGTVLPGDAPEPETPEETVDWVDVNSASNLWNNGIVTNITSWTSPSDWSGSTPEPTVTQEGNSFTLQYTEAPGSDQWQAQFGLETNLSFSADKKYDFRVTINPTCDINGATVKPTNFGDNSFWSDGRHDLYAMEDNVITLVGVSADMPDFKIVFDFAGVEANASIVVKDIIIQEHYEFSWVDVNSDANLWKGVKPTNFSFYTADNNWGGIANPTFTEGDNEYTLVYSEGPGNSQWQCQFAMETGLSFTGDKAYDFRVTITPTCDISGVTVKPTNFADDKFWSEGRHDVFAFEDNVIELKNVSADMPDFKIVFDFAGVEAGATIIVKDIIIQEH